MFKDEEKSRIIFSDEFNELYNVRVGKIAQSPVVIDFTIGGKHFRIRMFRGRYTLQTKPDKLSHLAQPIHTLSPNFT